MWTLLPAEAGWPTGMLIWAPTRALTRIRPRAARVRPRAPVRRTFEVARTLLIAGTRPGSGSSTGLGRPSRPRIGGLPVAPEGPLPVAGTPDRATVCTRRSWSARAEATGPGAGPVSTRTCGARAEPTGPVARSRAALAWAKRPRPFEPRTVGPWPLEPRPSRPRTVRAGPLEPRPSRPWLLPAWLAASVVLIPRLVSTVRQISFLSVGARRDAASG